MVEMHFLGLLLIRDGPVLAGVDVGALLLRQVLRKVLGHHGSGLQFGGEEALGAHLAQVGGGARLGLRLLQRVGARLLRVEVLPLTHARPGLLQVDALHARLQLRPAADPHAPADESISFVFREATEGQRGDRRRHKRLVSSSECEQGSSFTARLREAP